MNWSWIPNAITLARVLASLPLFWLLEERMYVEAFWLAVIAGLSDAADGIIAKRYGWQSVLGGVLDPIADKLLLTSSFLGLWWSLELPTWLVALVIGRDIVILCGAFAWWRLIGAFKPEPSLLSKATTLSQLIFLAMVLARLANHPIAEGWIPPVALATGALTLLSGVDYVVRYGMRAWRQLGKGE
jgi:cardiolipin synthase